MHPPECIQRIHDRRMILGPWLNVGLNHFRVTVPQPIEARHRVAHQDGRILAHPTPEAVSGPEELVGDPSAILGLPEG